MAGYSGTPLPRKLGINEGATVLLVDAPTTFPPMLEPLPPGVCFIGTAEPLHADVAVLFVTTPEALANRFASIRARLTPAGGLWVAWPKKSTGLAPELSENVIRGFGLATGMVDNKVCAIDEVWSGLRFVTRLADRPPARRRA